MGPLLFFIGLISIFGQVVVLRELSVAFYGVELIYILALGIWLAWSAAGAVFGKKNYSPPAWAVAGLLMVLGLVFPAEVAAIRGMRLFFGAVPGSYLPIGKQLAGVVICLLPPAFLLGLLFQWGARLHIAESVENPPGPKNLATAYAIESAGGIAGGLGSTLLLVFGVQNFHQSLICALLALAPIYFPSWRYLRNRNPILVWLGVFPAAVLLALLWKAPEIDRRTSQWNHPHLVASRDTAYHRVTIIERGGQHSVFENDALAFETQGTSAEEFVHLAALHHPNPEKVLVAGGGIEGLVHEFLKYNSIRIDYVELDRDLLDLIQTHVPGDFTRALKSDAVTVHIADARNFLADTGDSNRFYDVILVGMPPPSSGQSNRFYTSEFFRQCQNRLTPEGILALRLPSSENIWTPTLRYRNASIYKALEEQFDSVIVLPGTSNIIVASMGELKEKPLLLEQRFSQRELETRFVSPAYVRYLYTNDRFFQIRRTLETTPALPNTDTRPVCYSHAIIIWLSKLVPELIHWDVAFASPKKGFFIGLVIISTAGTIFFLVGFFRRGQTQRVLPVFTAAFIGMVFETMFLLYYQIKNGVLFQNIGLLLMVFMAGLAGGSVAVHAFRDRIGHGKKNGAVPLGRALFAGFALLGFCFWAVIYLDLAAGLFTMFFLMLLAGALVAAVLAFRSLAGKPAPQSVVSPLYAADLAGGCIGSVIASLLLVPVLGMVYSTLLMIFLSMAGMLFSEGVN